MRSREGGDALAAAGKYELKLELFDSLGNRVKLDDAGVLLKIPTIDAPFGPGEVPTTVASDEYRIKEAGKTIALRLVLHVDNNPCEAEIYTISGTGLNVNANCGFARATALFGLRALRLRTFPCYGDATVWFQE
jgi:hypothetical protein